MSRVLREYRMRFERVPPGQVAIDLDALGQRSKLGGRPDWDQDDETPACPICGEVMTFVAQLDSIEHQSRTNPHSVDALSGKQDYMFADVGMIYVFACLEHSQVAAVLQSG